MTLTRGSYFVSSRAAYSRWARRLVDEIHFVLISSLSTHTVASMPVQDLCKEFTLNWFSTSPMRRVWVWLLSLSSLAGCQWYGRVLLRSRVVISEREREREREAEAEAEAETERVQKASLILDQWTILGSRPLCQTSSQTYKMAWA